MKNWKFFWIVFILILFVVNLPVSSYSSSEESNIESIENPASADPVSQRFVSNSASRPSLTISYESQSIIEGEDANFIISANSPPRSDLNVELFVGITKSETTPSYIKQFSFVKIDTEFKLYKVPNLRFPAGQRQITYKLKTEDDFKDSQDLAVFAILNPDHSQNNYTVETTLKSNVTGTIVLNKQLSISVESLSNSVNIGEKVKFELTSSNEIKIARNVKLRYFGWYPDGTYRDEIINFPGVDQSKVIESELPIPNYILPSGLVVKVINGHGYVAAKPPNNRATVRINGLQPGIVSSDAPEIFIAAITSSVVEGQTAVFLIGSEDIPVQSNLSINLDVTLKGDFLMGSVPTQLSLAQPQLPQEDQSTKELRIQTRDDDRDEEDGSITIKILDGNNYRIAPATERIARIIIKDNDSFVELPIIQVGATRSSVNEGERANFIIAIQNEIRPTSALTININIDRIGNFFTGSPQTSHILSQGKDISDLFVDTVENSTYEPDGNIRVTILTGTGYFVSKSPGNSFIVHVLDKKTPTLPVIFIQANSTFTEGSMVHAVDERNNRPRRLVFSVISEPIAPTSDLEINVMVETEGTFNIFELNEDERQNSLQRTSTKTVVIKANQYTASFEFDVENNNWDQPDGSITATIISGTTRDYIVANKPHNSVKVKIKDDEDLPEISIFGTYTLVEGSSLEIPVRSIGISVAQIPVHFQILQNSSNFLIGRTLRTIILPAKTNFTSIVIFVLDDERKEQSGNISVQILNDFNTTPLYVVSESHSASVQISDNDEIPIISINAPIKMIQEGETAEFEILTVNSVSKQDILINLKISQSGNIILWRVPSLIKLNKLTNSVILYIPTIDDLEVTENDRIIVEILDDSNTLDLTYRVDQSNKIDSVSFADNDIGRSPVSNNYGPRISIAGLAVDAILQVNALSNSPSTYYSPSKIPESGLGFVEQILPIITIESTNQSVNVGSPIILNIRASTPSNMSIEISLNVTDPGGYVQSPIPLYTRLEAGEVSTKVTIPTVDLRQNEPESLITVQINESSTYLIGLDNEVSVKVIGNLSEIRKRKQFNAVNQSLTPELLSFQGRETINSTLDRSTAAFSGIKTESTNIDSLNLISELVVKSGEYLNSNLDSLGNIISNRSFSLQFFPENNSTFQTSVWGKSNFQYLSKSSARTANNWKGQSLSGQLGFDTKIENRILVGMALSRAETDVDFNIEPGEVLDVHLHTSILYPYFGLNLDEWNTQLQTTTGFGQMLISVENSENNVDKNTTDILISDFRASKQLYTNEKLESENTKSLSIVGQTSYIKSIDKEGQDLGYNSQISLSDTKLVAEARQNIEFESNSVLDQMVSFGVYSQNNDSESDIGLELLGESEFSIPYGISVKGQGHLEVVNSDSESDWYIGGSINYDENLDGVGTNLTFSPVLGKNKKIGTTLNWHRDNLFSLKDPSSEEIEFRINSKLGYGVSVFENLGTITPFTDLQISNKYFNEFNIGTRLATGSDLGLEFKVNWKRDSNQDLNQSYLIKGNIQW